LSNNGKVTKFRAHWYILQFWKRISKFWCLWVSICQNGVWLVFFNNNKLKLIGISSILSQWRIIDSIFHHKWAKSKSKNRIQA